MTGVRRSVALAAAVDRLRAAGVASPEHDAAELLAHVHGLERRDLFRIDTVAGDAGRALRDPGRATGRP